MIDVLDVHRALFDARAAGGARPQHVGVDHAQRCGVTHQWAGGLQWRIGGHPLETGLRNVVRIVMPDLQATLGVRRAVLGPKDVGRLGEQMIAEIHDEDLGGQRLSGVPGRTLRLAAAALGTRR